MKVLLIIAHGCEDASSHSHKLAQAAKDALMAAHHEVRVLDLLKEGFGVTLSKRDFVGYDESKPFNAVKYQSEGKLVQSIKDAQKTIEWATHLIVIGPMWFYRLPSIFESFIERVFTYGWAYDFTLPADKKPLSLKKMMIAITTGGGPEYYGIGNGVSGIEGFLFPDTSSLQSMGMKVLKSLPIYGVDKLSEEQWAEKCRKFSDIVVRIDNREEIPFEDPKYKGQDRVSIAVQIPDELI